MTILFSGGGTLGPVMPLLATADTLKRTHPEVKLLFVGTHDGVEEAVVLAHGIRFIPMIAAKLQRYATIRLLFQPFIFLVSLVVASPIILKEKPSIVIAAGGFVSVPLHIIAWIAGIPSIVHQQDFEVGLANKLMAPLATLVTTVFPETVALFNQKKTFHIGNPIRRILTQGDSDRAIARFHLEAGIPTVLIFGGGTGALRVNVMVSEIVGELCHTVQILHVTGSGKNTIVPRLMPRDTQYKARYHVFEFLMDEEMADAYAIADLVVARAGLSSISEIAALGKASILIPIHDNHQEYNAQYVAQRGGALVFDERESSAGLRVLIHDLMQNPEKRDALRNAGTQINSQNAAEVLANKALSLITKKSPQE